MSGAGGRRRAGRHGRREADPVADPVPPPSSSGPESAAQAAQAEAGAGPAAAGGPATSGAREAEGGAAPAGPPHVDRSVCLCAGLGPMLTAALRTLSVPDEVKQSLHDTEREALRLLRTLIEMRLSSLGPDDGRPREPRHGVKLDVT